MSISKNQDAAQETAPTKTPDIRGRILAAAADLIAEGGTSEATTRAVALRAGTQAPTIYRMFGDKDGMLQAAAEFVLTRYVTSKARGEVQRDPVENLRNGWDTHIAFGLENPDIFRLIYTGPPSKALDDGHAHLKHILSRAAKAGGLKVSVDQAVDVMHSISTGTVLTLLNQNPDRRNPDLARITWEAVKMRLMTPDSPANDGTISTTASALQAMLQDMTVLSEGERSLMGELLERIANGQ